jgi:hypothetical protein
VSRKNLGGYFLISGRLGATGWITLSEARALFGEMDQVGKASLVAFAEEREHRRARPDAGTRRIRVR